MGNLKPIFRPQLLRSAFALFQSPANLRPVAHATSRSSSSTRTAPPPEIPSPIPFCPDVPTFLTLIGRGLSSHASKFPSWEALFSLDSSQLRELGIEPPRTRRYLIQWRRRFQRGQYGIGGDLKHVEDGVAELRILEHLSEQDPLRPKKLVVNVPLGQTIKSTPVDELSRVTGYKVKGAKTIVGPYAIPIKEEAGVHVKVTEGMWEDKLGVKIDGGERRRTQVRYKKHILERREARERAEKP